MKVICWVEVNIVLLVQEEWCCGSYGCQYSFLILLLTECAGSDSGGGGRMFAGEGQRS